MINREIKQYSKSKIGVFGFNIVSCLFNINLTVGNNNNGNFFHRSQCFRIPDTIIRNPVSIIVEMVFF